MKKIITTLFLVLSATVSIPLMAKTLELSATVISDNEKYITSRYMGFIEDVFVSEGDSVKKGTLLYTIDSTEIQSKKRQASLSVQMYENQYNIMQRNYERFVRLYKKGLVSKFEVEQLELGSKNLEDMVKIAKLQVQEVENQYQYLSIKAPNNGVIITKNIKAGEMAIPGMPALVLSDLSDLKISFEVGEKDLKDIKQGQKVDIEIPSLNHKTVGKITAIIPSSNPMTHSFTVKVGFQKSENIYPGMYAKIFIDIPTQTK